MTLFRRSERRRHFPLLLPCKHLWVTVGIWQYGRHQLCSECGKQRTTT